MPTTCLVFQVDLDVLNPRTSRQTVPRKFASVGSSPYKFAPFSEGFSKSVGITFSMQSEPLGWIDEEKGIKSGPVSAAVWCILRAMCELDVGKKFKTKIACYLISP